MYLTSKWRMYECAPDSSLLSRVLEKPKTEHKLWPGCLTGRDSFSTSWNVPGQFTAVTARVLVKARTE